MYPRLPQTHLMVFGPLLAVALAACASQSGAQFPSNEELQRLAEKPAADRPRAETWADVEEWDLTGPLPDRVTDEPAPAKGVWVELLADITKGRSGLVMASSSAHCVARELGLFFAAKHARATSSLERFVAGRCGLTSTAQVSHGYSYVPAHDDTDEVALFGKLAPGLKEQLQKNVGSMASPNLVGIWFGVKNGIAVASWVVAARQVRIDPVAMVPGADGHIVVRGEVLTNTDHVEALINRGTYGFRRCEVDSTVRMPQFNVRCEADPTDVSTTIQVAAFEPGRVIGRTVLSLLHWPKGKPEKHYRRPTLVDLNGDEAQPSTHTAADLAAVLGQVRGQAGMTALHLSTPESATARRLAPHYFAALSGIEDQIIADRVVLGLRAGWEVGAPLRSGEFTSGFCEGPCSTARLLSDVLEMPSGREALLNPESNHLAIGVVGDPAKGFVGAVFSSYSTFELGDEQANVEKVHHRLDALRTLKGVARAEVLPQVESDVAAIVREVSSGRIDANQGLDKVLSKTAARTHSAVSAHYADALDLDKVTIPVELLTSPSLRLAIAVGQHQPSGDPWRRYIVYFVAVSGPDTVALAFPTARRTYR